MYIDLIGAYTLLNIMLALQQFSKEYNLQLVVHTIDTSRSCKRSCIMEKALL